MNSSSFLCQCRCDDQAPALSVTRLTPNWLRPTALPRRLRSRPTIGCQNGSGYLQTVSTGILAISIFGIASHPLDDPRGAHADADAQRPQRGRKIAPLQFVEHGAEDHCAGGAEWMAHGDGAAIDVDLLVIDVELLHV